MQTTYGNIALDTAQFHPNSIDALVRRGISHYLGNEMASKVTAWVEKEIKSGVDAFKAANPTVKLDDAKMAALVSKVTPSDDDKAAKKAEFQTAGVASLLDGTIGQGGERGPRVDPIESEMRVQARAGVLATLKGAGLKAPKGDGVVTFADGQTRTMAQMIDKRLTTQAEALRHAADKALKEKAKKAEKDKADAAKIVGNGPVQADALGL